MTKIAGLPRGLILIFFTDIMANKKRTLTEIENILVPGNEYLSAVTIPILKNIIFQDLGMNEQFIIMNVADRRKLLDWFLAAKKALNQAKLIEEKNDNII